MGKLNGELCCLVINNLTGNNALVNFPISKDNCRLKLFNEAEVHALSHDFFFILQYLCLLITTIHFSQISTFSIVLKLRISKKFNYFENCFTSEVNIVCLQ